MASKYTILYQEDKQGGFSGQCLELPGAISEGETIKKLKANMVDAVYLALTSVNTDMPSPINICLVYSGCDFDPIS
jgi:predicted RNase H-like HicB family nuclease